MDDFLNQINTPAFWLLFTFNIIGSIVANRLDRQLPPVSIVWLEVLIYLYSIFGIAVTLNAFFFGGYFPFNYPNDHARNDAFVKVLFAFFMPCLWYLSQDARK